MTATGEGISPSQERWANIEFGFVCVGPGMNPHTNPALYQAKKKPLSPQESLLQNKYLILICYVQALVTQTGLLALLPGLLQTLSQARCSPALPTTASPQIFRRRSRPFLTSSSDATALAVPSSSWHCSPCQIPPKTVFDPIPGVSKALWG